MIKKISFDGTGTFNVPTKLEDKLIEENKFRRLFGKYLTYQPFINSEKTKV